VTLPLLEGVRRLASWSVPAEQSIAAATITPRRVLGDGRRLPEMLVGTPLGEALRWSQAEEGLSWRRAGRPTADRYD
jgi:N-acetylglucosamine-6-phosphate deacetylase